ncbi:AAA family ATPase [Galbibacter sp.]|uniref:AAA family ATPase n=1 Tax=Galbibacter sp. TaxID=2918471 RepID=UPI002B8ADA41|nr:AAA family ATPase [Galbibacter sp.]HLV64126.1 AAA family ATPase [Galbibacter sp.]
MFKEENLKEMILDHQGNSEKTVNEKPIFEITTGMDLIEKVKNEPEPKFIWKGIPEGSIGLLAGAPKTGKTTFAENLATSMAIGRKEFFNWEMDGNPRKVLFVNLEENYKIRSRRNAKQIESLNTKEKELFGKHFISTPDNFPEYLNDTEDWKILRDYIKRSQAEIVFIDSISHMCVGEIEKSVIAQSFTKMIRMYLGNLDKTIIAIHHTTKGNDKPITMHSIAGSRFINQEFQYAIGFGNIPTKNGGNYAFMLYNKYIENDESTAFLYKINENGWFDYLETSNKYDLYKHTKRDGRKDDTNLNLIYDYIKSKSSTDSTMVKSKELISTFVSTSTMSKDTLYKKLDIIENEGALEKIKKGLYEIKNDNDNGTKA